MRETKVPMCYDRDFGRWKVKVEGVTHGLHCGESLRIYICGQPMQCRLEFGRTHWYVIADGARFSLMENEQYTISL